MGGGLREFVKGHALLPMSLLSAPPQSQTPSCRYAQNHLQSVVNPSEAAAEFLEVKSFILV